MGNHQGIGISLTGIAQQPKGADMAVRLREVLAYVRRARELGFDFIYQGQHYLAAPYQQLQTMPLLARVAAEAEGMGVAATAVLPLHHPVDLAERTATLDVITGGRFVLVAALGYRDEEYSAFGVRRDERVSRFLECLETVRRLWTEEEVTHRGRHFRLEGARLGLRPLQSPHPPIWVAASSDAAVERAARRGFPWYVNPHADYPTIQRQVGLYRRAADEAGLPTPGLPAGRELYVADSRERAMREVAPYLGGKYETYAQWGQDRALPGQESFSAAFEELARDRFIIGSPEECAEELARYRALGVSRFLVRMAWPGMPLDQGLEVLERVAGEVAPLVNGG